MVNDGDTTNRLFAPDSARSFITLSEKGFTHPESSLD
jgi:hypothetical protein